MERYNEEDLRDAARNWLPVSRRDKFRRMKKGYASANWVFTHKSKRYVLKRFMDFKKREDVLAEYRISEYVAKEGFPYEIPRMIAAKDGRPFAEVDGKLYSLYRFIPGSTGMQVNENDAYEIGVMVARLHDIIERSRFVSKGRKGFQTIERIVERIGRNEAEAHKRKDSSAGAFLSACRWFIPALEVLDLSYYKTLKVYAVHCDIGPANIVWSRGSIRGLLDFSNMSGYRDALLMDLAWAIHFCCVDMKTGSSYSKRLLSSLLEGYTSIRSLSKEDMRTLPNLVIIANAFDFEFAYYLQSVTEKDQAARILNDVKLSKWLLRNASYFRKSHLLPG